MDEDSHLGHLAASDNQLLGENDVYTSDPIRYPQQPEYHVPIDCNLLRLELTHIQVPGNSSEHLAHFSMSPVLPAVREQRRLVYDDIVRKTVEQLAQIIPATCVIKTPDNIAA